MLQDPPDVFLLVWHVYGVLISAATNLRPFLLYTFPVLPIKLGDGLRVVAVIGAIVLVPCRDSWRVVRYLLVIRELHSLGDGSSVAPSGDVSSDVCSPGSQSCRSLLVVWSSSGGVSPWAGSIDGVRPVSSAVPYSDHDYLKYLSSYHKIELQIARYHFLGVQLGESGWKTVLFLLSLSRIMSIHCIITCCSLSFASMVTTSASVMR